jgi:hypothetical protein
LSLSSLQHTLHIFFYFAEALLLFFNYYKNAWVFWDRWNELESLPNSVHVLVAEVKTPRQVAHLPFRALDCLSLNYYCGSEDYSIFNLSDFLDPTGPNSVD